MSDDEMKVWIRGFAAPATASQARSISAAFARASAAIWQPRISRAICRTEAKSPSEATGKPASMISTPIFSSWRAIRSFSSGFMLAPGDCSPSLSVVSKIKTLFPVASISDSFHAE